MTCCAASFNLGGRPLLRIILLPVSQQHCIAPPLATYRYPIESVELALLVKPVKGQAFLK
jgi:hypothetical protein